LFVKASYVFLSAPPTELPAEDCCGPGRLAAAEDLEEVVVGVAVGARLGGILVVWYGGGIEGDVAVGG